MYVCDHFHLKFFLFVALLEHSRLQNNVSLLEQNQNQLIDTLNTLKTQHSDIAEHKKKLEEKGNELVVTMQTLIGWPNF